ncbi:Hypothetical predicted protein [Marmota monax]|uniref:ADAMTS cysteine-rich domain-containing protein n=1 Tax=Marmota monax TaxID=9995 RepID=A0A5E4ACM5_MARMO|nr:Hypothetical predicted protein [Marmota monax]
MSSHACLLWQGGQLGSAPAVCTEQLANADLLLPSSPGPGGTHCLGASVEHAVCESLPCPKGLPSFRDQQCQAHDRLSSKKKGLLAAVVVDDKPCELYCSPLGKESPLLVADRVLDGTPCGPYETDLCVHGRCQGAHGGGKPLGGWGRGFLKEAPDGPPSSSQLLLAHCPALDSDSA